MLDRLQRKPGSRKLRRRVGRGIGSGQGRTCGRGQKGAGARAGSKRRAWSEGGQMPMARRLPKVGFTNIFRKPPQVVNVGALERFRKGSVVDAPALAAAGLVSRADGPVKVLGQGKLSKALKLKVHAVSASARKKVDEAGGSVEIVAPRRGKAGSAESGSS